MRITPEDIILNSHYKLLAKVHHDTIKPFIIEQLSKNSPLAVRYKWYQLSMLIVLGGVITYGIVHALRGSLTEISHFFTGAFLSITILVFLHELIHVLALLLVGIRNISIGFNLWKFIFYVHADRQVITSKKFYLVALAPLIVVKIICIAAIIWAFLAGHSVVIWFTIMSVHSFFCAGDIGLISLYENHPDEDIVTFDIKEDRCSYFYAKKRS